MELKEDAIAALGSAKPAFLEAEGAEQQGAWPNATWMITGSRLPKAPPRLADYGVKERLIARWHEVAQEDAASRAAAGAQPGTGQPVGDFVNAQQRALFSICSSYKDVFLPAREYPQSGDSPDALMDACLLHCLNHVTTAAGRIKKNNDRLKANPDDEVLRDQGFTRPKVLLLLPMRNSALRVVSRLVQLAQKETRADSVQNKQRFLEEFGAEEGDDEPEELDGKRRMQPKPADHKALFDGNCDDHFRMGVKITRGAVRLFSDFFQSDIIVASPLALATKINEASKEGAATVDFLSAIEIAVVERADVLQMQNWIHVKTVFDALNKVPEEQHGVDIMRVREWYLSGWGRFYRQTIVLSSFASAEMNALFNRTCVNHAGKARLRPVYKGVLGQTNAPLRQLFERFEPADAGSDADARFEYFKKTIWLRIRESGSTGQLIFVPSYFDFVRLRNFLKAEAAHFVGLCEYAKHSDVSRGRSHFFHGRRRIMLYTERAHFYNRYRIRGVKDVYFYQLPEHATAYAELLASLTDSAAASGDEFHQATVTALFSRFDTLQLERVVGSGRHRKMLKPGTSTFMFC
ncbi:hypothetical protein WJX72_001434 [[Myrmecia] bisecta]|uniref:U3 small nucleolar RNA-associated protein 25 n=1 Tax=[Myrmecia] bisecta TaxID=41462 RepID=A0AAW1QP16_9CHLO